MDKEDVIYIHIYIYNGILLSHKKEWNNATCSNMDGPRDYHTKWSKKKIDIIWYHLYVQYKISYKWTYLQTRNRHRKQTYGYQAGKRVGG